ncbi:MAG: FHA domain-containing protein [Rhodoferax sp.]|nr:FHA domain-containing protein [Rhodoferax sp.]
MPKIILSTDGMPNREVELNQTKTRLGRRPCNDVVIDDLAVSGEHALLHLSGLKVLLQDLGSTNGTWVHGQAVHMKVLHHGDVIRMGTFSIRLQIDGSPEQPGPACLQVLTGPWSGHQLALTKPQTTIGKAAMPIATICKFPRGFVVQQMADAAVTATLNGIAIGTGRLPLKNGDVIGLAGNQLQFLQV